MVFGDFRDGGATDLLRQALRGIDDLTPETLLKIEEEGAEGSCKRKRNRELVQANQQAFLLKDRTDYGHPQDVVGLWLRAWVDVRGALAQERISLLTDWR